MVASSDHHVPHSFWVEVLDHLNSRPGSLRLPLKSNGYLFEVLGSMGEELAAKTEREREAELRRGGGRESAPVTRTEPKLARDIIADMKEQIR